MLYLLAAGSAYPANSITNDLLEEAGRGVSAAQVEQETGVLARSTVLDPEYIRQTGNADVFAAAKATHVATSELGYQAALQAIERAGITAESIGLVIGESSTPIETTPSEAQRVANRLGLRCPAYDVVGSCASFALHVDTLLNWREEALPDYTLCVYSNAPTTRVNYREGTAGWIAGDAGAAVVLSPRKVGPLVVRDAFGGVLPALSDLTALDTLGHFEMRSDFVKEFVEPKADEMLMRAAKQHALSLQDTRIIAAQLTERMVEGLSQRHGVPLDRLMRQVAARGYSFGSMPVSVLADHWSSLRPGDKIVAVMSGSGFSFGYVYLTA